MLDTHLVQQIVFGALLELFAPKVLVNHRVICNSNSFFVCVDRRGRSEKHYDSAIRRIGAFANIRMRYSVRHSMLLRGGVDR